MRFEKKRKKNHKFAAAKHHLGPIKTQVWKAYVTACLLNEIIVSNEITGYVKPIPVFMIKTGHQSTLKGVLTLSR